MKLTADAKSLIEAIHHVTTNFDTKEAGAYVALIVSADGEAHMFHANLTSFMRAGFEVSDAVIEDGDLEGARATAALDGGYLRRLATAVSGLSGDVTLRKDMSDKRSPLEILTPNGKFTVPVYDAPVSREPELIELGEIDDREYFDSLQRLAKLCDPENEGFLPVLGAVDVRLDVDARRIVMMATDRYALGEITVGFEPAEAAAEYAGEFPSVLLPVKSATAVSPSKGLTSSTTLVHDPAGRKFGYVFGDGRAALFSLKDAEPLNYASLKKKAGGQVQNSITVATAELRRAIASVSALAWDEMDIYLDITRAGVTVRDSYGRNKIRVEAEAIETDDDYSVKFVRNIITESFSPVSTGKMNVRWLSANAPFVIEPVLDDGTPMKNVFVLLTPSE